MSHGNVLCRRCRHESQCPLFAGLAKHRHKTGPSSTERSVSQLFAPKLRWFGRVGMARKYVKAGISKKQTKTKVVEGHLLLKGSARLCVKRLSVFLLHVIL